MNILKLLRDRNKFTQEFIAEKLGVTRQSYMRYETGEIELSSSQIRTLANLYQIEYRNIIDDIMPEQALSEGVEIYANEITKMENENLIEMLNTAIHKDQTKKIIPLKRANLNYLTGTEVCFLHREFSKYSTEFKKNYGLISQAVRLYVCCRLCLQCFVKSFNRDL